MGNLEDYNWHKTMGPAAGPPTSVGGFLGQQDNLHMRDAPRQSQGDGSGPQDLGSWLNSLPHWLVTHPIRRGFAVMVAANLIALAPVPIVLSAVAGLAGLFGTAWMIGGIVAFIARRARG